ncbi:ABC transporter permease [Methanonatronarchaeum sp. AMET-Sl]|uniref:ABC transporter permease n=1 Tax=Methanonatronarchaeum sp. AMET-Sl TaxID=3037654 RepID=UPI00244DE808|nr:ABC transporter permease [Methanonatronarchaeum sp. AMET-Sl]WGI17061.1 ABC transporter permease [Methanonatronarchaeum sp. AMET-Sl]
MNFDIFKKTTPLINKNLRIYYCKGPVVIFGILVPMFFFLAFSLGRDMTTVFFASGIIGMTLWFTATSVSPVITPWETREKTLERLLTMPITVRSIILADIISSSILGILITGAAIIFIAIFMDIVIYNPIVLFLALIPSAFCYSAIGSLMSAYPTDKTSDVMMVATLIKFPIIFVSGIFIPIEELPTAGLAIAYLSPLTYFVETIKNVLTGSSAIPELILIWILAIIFTIIAIKTHKKTIPKRI